MRVIFCGTRGWNQDQLIIDQLKSLPPDTIVIHGGARGADFIAGREATALGLTVEVYPAKWTQYGRTAGTNRNIQMLKTGVDKVFAFWDGVSPGTRHMINISQKAGVPVEITYARWEF